MTAGIYYIKNSSNNRVYVGSSRNIERRFISHFEGLRSRTHHSWKLQEDWDRYGEKNSATEIIHVFDISEEHLELLLEIFERSEVLIRGAVSNGYNVSDEIIRDTSLVLKFCDEAIDTYFRVNKERFAAANAQFNQVWFFTKLKRWASPESHQDGSDTLSDVDHHASEYLQTSLTKLFVKSGLDEKNSTILADSYVIDVKKMRGNSFRYWGRDKKSS